MQLQRKGQKPHPSCYTFYYLLFFSTLPPTERCQLQATVKHKPLIGGDQILGVASVPFDVIMKSRVYTMNLNGSLYHDERGRAFLTVLALRNNDEIARDFVILRTYRRIEAD